MKILISDGIEDIGKKILTEAGFEITDKKLLPDELLKVISSYDAIVVRSATKVTKEVIDAGIKLKVIARGGVGLDNIDVKYAESKGIKVLNTPGASSISVAELAIAHMFALCRFLYVSTGEMRNMKWPKKEYSKGIELTGKTLGIFGLGNIGKEVAKRAIGLGMKVIAYDPIVKSTDLNVKLTNSDEVLKTSDFISLHIPFDKKAGPTITQKEFDKMKKGVVLVNCARGGVVSEKDLFVALKSGKVAAAGIDVFESEPTSEVQKELLNHPNVSSTPHIGASTNEAQERVGEEIATKVVSALK
jgi:D-3-phosphoglycerate dehydrogenase / 2-oxoglutarate reductase